MKAPSNTDIMVKLSEVMVEFAQIKEKLATTEKEVADIKLTNNNLANNDMILKGMIDDLKAKDKEVKYFG